MFFDINTITLRHIIKQESIMIYTQNRRRAMNKAVRSLYPDIDFYESPGGIPVMECRTLPSEARRIEYPEDLFDKVKKHCVRINDMGMHIPDFGKAYPVFIHSVELNGRDVHHYYRVNYVSATESSKQRAAEYIAEGKLYAVM